MKCYFNMIFENVNFLALRKLCVILLETLLKGYLLWMFWKTSSKQWRLNMLHNRPTKAFQENGTMNDVQMTFWEQITLNTNILLMLLEKNIYIFWIFDF